MKQDLIKGWRMLLVLLAVSLLAMFAGALPVAAGEYDANPERELPATVVPGQEFEVTVTFTSPADLSEMMELTEAVPAGWLVTVSEDRCSPAASSSSPPTPWAPGPAEYMWTGPYDLGEEFTAVYEVRVPADVEPGVHGFSGTLAYGIAGGDMIYEDVGGDSQVMVLPPASGQVGLKARTAKATGSIELIKLFVPDDTEFPRDKIEVQVTDSADPNVFDETYTLTRGDEWKKTIHDIPVGTYTVHELTVVFGWIPSYDPGDRQLVVGVGDVATMTITNTHSVIGISVTPSEIDFGEITPGETINDTGNITVENIGTLNIDVDVELDADTKYDADNYFYTAALKLNDIFSDQHATPTELGAWTAEDLGLENIAPAGSEDVTTELECPAEMYPDVEYTGTLVFWAVATDD